MGCEAGKYTNDEYFRKYCDWADLNEGLDVLKQDDVSDYVFSCSTSNKEKRTKGNFEIQSSHAYSLEPVDIDGERKFIVRNPHNSACEEIFSEKELLKYFDEIIAAKIK